MKEAIKGVVINQCDDNLKIKGVKVYKYLIAAVLITDTPIKNIGNTQETIILLEKNDLDLTNFLSRCEKYPVNNLGDLDQAMLYVSNMNIEEIKNTRTT